ncbi:unnamed protein product, partial [Didymodactylos carnosus]
IHTESNLPEVQVISLINETLPRYTLRADTEFSCSNQDFIQTPIINSSDIEGFSNQEIQLTLDYFQAVTRLLEERERDLNIAAGFGKILLESNDQLKQQVSLLEQDIDQTTEMVQQLKHDLLLKDRLIRFYGDMELDMIPPEERHFDNHHFEQKIRNLEYENRELRSETLQLRSDTDTFDQKERNLVNNCVNALANANAQVDHYQQEFIKKNDESNRQQEEIKRITYEMREVRRRLLQLKKENEELKVLLSLSGKSKQEYELRELEKNYEDCVEKLHKSQSEVLILQQQVLTAQLPSSSTIVNENCHHHTQHTLFLSPTDYANFMGMENSLKYEFEEVDIDPYELYPTPATETSIKFDEQNYKRLKWRSDTDDSSINDSAYSDTESLSSVWSCRHREFKEKLDSDQQNRLTTSTSSMPGPRRLPASLCSRLRLVKRLEGSAMLKRWQELATPSFSSCLQSIPGVYTRAEILQGLKEEDETNMDNDERTVNDTTLDCPSKEKCQEDTSTFLTDGTKRTTLLQLLKDHDLTANTFEQIDHSPTTDSVSSYVTASTKIDLMKDSQKNLLSSHNNVLSSSSSHSISKPTTLNLNLSPSLVMDPDDDNSSPETPPSTPIQNSYLQTNVLLNQVMQRLIGLSFRTIQSLTSSLSTNVSSKEDTQTLTSPITTKTSDICPTPPSSPTFELVTPTPNTAKKIMKTSTFIRVSALNPYTNKCVRDAVAQSASPNEVSPALAEFTRSLKWK